MTSEHRLRSTASYKRRLMFLCKLRRWNFCSCRKTQWVQFFFSPLQQEGYFWSVIRGTKDVLSARLWCHCTSFYILCAPVSHLLLLGCTADTLQKLAIINSSGYSPAINSPAKVPVMCLSNRLFFSWIID